jgi:hypothetical protein
MPWTLLQRVARLSLAMAVTFSICGFFRTVVLHIGNTCVLSNSRNGISLTLLAEVLDERDKVVQCVRVRHPHADDSGLFFNTTDQQFVPSFYIPGFYIICGGWGVSEQGTIRFVMSDPKSMALAITHSLVLACAVSFNMLTTIGFYRHSSPKMNS